MSMLLKKAGHLMMACLFVCMVTACAPEEPPPEDVIIPRPTVIVVTAEGPYYTTFDTPGSWLVGDNTRSEGRIVDGRYVMSIREARTLAWTHQTRSFGPGVY
ncbi:MAG: hypothetical protein ACFB51_18475, partial [Anaerolineae bacterium]